MLQKFKAFSSFNSLTAARWLVIMELVALLFSPPLTNLFELSLFALFICSDDLRKRMLLAIKQPMVIATLLFYLSILIATTYSIESWTEALKACWAWRKIWLLPISVALFDDEFWKQKLASIFIKISTACAVASYLGVLLNHAFYRYEVGIIIRNHATQGIIFSVAAFTAGIFLITNPTIFSKPQKWALSACILVLVSNIIYVTPGRSGYLALIVLSLTTALAYVYLNKKFVTPLIVLTLLPILLLSSPNVRQRVSQGVGEAERYKSTTTATSMGIRIVLWKNTLGLIRAHPLIGYGTGSFRKAYKTTVENEPEWKQTIMHDPHNQFLKITTEQGILGLIIFVGMILSAFWQKASFTYRFLGLGIMLVWVGNSQFSSHFSTFSEGRFVYIWCGVMLATRLGQSKKWLSS